MKSVLSVKGLQKSFGKKEVLHDISFEIHEGEIVGFVGPNGAGKTTTIKCIVGLQKPNEGTIIINGFDIQKDFKKAISSVGAIVEGPDLYSNLTGRKNLQMIMNNYKGIDKSRLDDVIKISGLGKRIDSKVSTYSLGMKQRLGIAAALINKPEVLILDEPTNGLDPQGIKELRDFIKEVAGTGCAVLISSHSLLELESFITHVCMIKNGKVIYNGLLSDLKENGNEYIFEVSDVDKCIKLFKDKYVRDVSNRLVLNVKTDDIKNVLKEMLENDIDIYSFTKCEDENLEDVFFKKVGGNEID